MRVSKLLSLMLITSSSLALLSACGGGSSSSNNGNNNSGNSSNGSSFSWVAGQYDDYDDLAGLCEANNTGSALTEKLWIRSYSNDTYLWYDELPDPNPDSYSISDYFDVMKTEALTPSGKLKDQFHSSMPTEEWIAQSQSGSSLGYGLNISIQQGLGIERTITVTYTDANSPASAASIDRGDKILAIDGVDVATANTQSEINTLNGGLFPSDSSSHDFVVLQQGEERTVTLTPEVVASDPVPIVKTETVAGKKIGYIAFHSHNAIAESGLFDAFTELAQENVDELVIDYRYNGGGFLRLASETGYMISGEQTQGEVFETLTFNDKHTTNDPITGAVLSPTPFYGTSYGFSANDLSGGVSLPTLNLNRVFVLTSGNTCSASESLINGLRGIGVEVIQVGTTTCGKPYGFYPTDNCGTTYFTVQFSGENADGFGDYADGFTPSEMPNLPTDIQGCPVDDDFTQPLGNAQEQVFASALHYIEYGECPELPMVQQAAHKQVRGSSLKVIDNRSHNQVFNNTIYLK